MKFGFIIPVLTDIDINQTVNVITQACGENDFDVIFALNGNMNKLFSKIRNKFIDNEKVKGFMINQVCDEHKLITIAMEKCSTYDATIIYSGKELVNADVIHAFISSWEAGNKIVYLKKQVFGIKKIFLSIARAIYNLGLAFLGLYKDFGGETDIQLLDSDVVKTINQLPQKNRQLRVLDSFVGYTTDIIQVEVDPKMLSNSHYVEKNKKSTISKIISISSLIVSCVFLILFIVGNAVKLNISFYVNMIFILIFIVGLIFALIYNTKRELYIRIGTPFDLDELNNLKEKLEKYNFK